MKRLEISEETRAKFEYNMDWWKYVRQQWIDAGFDMNKSVTQEFSNETRHIIFTQEDSNETRKEQ